MMRCGIDPRPLSSAEWGLHWNPTDAFGSLILDGRVHLRSATPLSNEWRPLPRRINAANKLEIISMIGQPITPDPE